MTEHRLQPATIDYTGTDYIPPEVQGDEFWPRMTMVADIVRQIRIPTVPVVDLGCNAGHLLELLGTPCWGYDIATGPLTVAAQAGHVVRQTDITKDDLLLAPIVTICEVLEHLEDPHGMVKRLACDPVQFVVASGPWEETPEDFYEQHCWAWDLEGFRLLFEDSGFVVTKQVTTGSYQALLAMRTWDVLTND